MSGRRSYSEFYNEGPVGPSRGIFPGEAVRGLFPAVSHRWPVADDDINGLGGSYSGEPVAMPVRFFNPLRCPNGFDRRAAALRVSQSPMGFLNGEGFGESSGGIASGDSPIFYSW